MNTKNCGCCYQIAGHIFSIEDNRQWGRGAKSISDSGEEGLRAYQTVGRGAKSISESGGEGLRVYQTVGKKG